MTVWLLRLALTPEEEAQVEQRTHLSLPFGDLPDLSMVTSAVECRHLLKALYPEEPPESITRRVERIWPYYSQLQPEDIIAVPLPNRREVALAEVTGPYTYRVGVSGSDLHLLPVKWHKPLGWWALRKHPEMLTLAGAPISEVAHRDVRIIIRDRMPASYNRFVRWKWLLVVFFVMGLVLRVLHLMKAY